jgi:deoxyribodipyrimidine photo-lyase
MRAMLVSFASYQLWLHWQKPAQFLAKHFLDFEPGIHFSQFQMQSGVTGINAIRIYSPQKQTKDQDPSGDFIRTFCPELKDIPDIYLSDPQSTPPLIQMEAGCLIGRDYPEPIVDGGEAYKKAKERIYGWKGQQHVREQSKKVYLKHGSRDNKHFPKQKRDR